MPSMKSMVVAYDQNRGIGANNELLFRLPADLKHFKETTMGGSIIMGRKTYESIGRALPGRKNIVVSHQELSIPDVTTVNNLPAAYQAAEGEIYIIGGGTIFEQALPDTDVVYATEVQASFPNAAVFFPVLGSDWHEVSREHHEPDEKNNYPYDFVVYKRS